MFTWDKTLTSETNFWLLWIRRMLWLEFLENVISYDSLKTLSAIHFYKIKGKFISNTRSIEIKWSITTVISPIKWTFQRAWNNLNFKGKKFESFKKFILLKLILATVLNCWQLQKISANAYNCPKQSCDWTFEQLEHYYVQLF